MRAGTPSISVPVLRGLLTAHPVPAPVRSGHDIACDADYLNASCICDEISPAPEVCGNCLGHGVETCAAHPAPVSDTRREDVARAEEAGAQASWRPVVGFEGAYEVSDRGRVRSLDRLDSRGNRIRGRVLRAATKRSGHQHLSLCVDGKGITLLVHRMVLEAFVGPAPEGMEACHSDGDPANNALSNLRWDSRSENTLDRVRHGTHHLARKTHCPVGHPYDADNTHFDKRGDRICRECKRERNRAARLRGATRG
ncbi:hypothetical protein ASE27_10240 [Oerskovia sp. Root918]|nr:hypothetical protein ASE27_10240 [Oerskovia sp. Root918]